MGKGKSEMEGLRDGDVTESIEIGCFVGSDGGAGGRVKLLPYPVSQRAAWRPRILGVVGHGGGENEPRDAGGAPQNYFIAPGVYIRPFRSLFVLFTASICCFDDSLLEGISD